MGFCFFVDPKLDSKSVVIYWAGSIKSMVLNCTTYTSKNSGDCYSLNLAKLKYTQYSVLTFGGKKVLNLSNDFGTVQLNFDEDVDLDKPLKFTISIASSVNIFKQVEAIKNLESILGENYKMKSKSFAVLEKFEKPEILYAQDFITKGITQKNLAKKLYGEDVVKKRWDGISDSLRAQTRRLIAQAEDFVNTNVFDFF